MGRVESRSQGLGCALRVSTARGRCQRRYDTVTSQCRADLDQNAESAQDRPKACSWVSLSVAFFGIVFWLSPRMRLSSPDHSPLIARTRVLAICSFCRFSSYNTASGRFYQPGETFMTHLTYSGLCCFFILLKG